MAIQLLSRGLQLLCGDTLTLHLICGESIALPLFLVLHFVYVDLLTLFIICICIIILLVFHIVYGYLLTL